MVTNTPKKADFDNWTEEQERAALEDLQHNSQVKHIIKDNKLYVRVPSGSVYALNLTLSIDEYADLVGVGDADNVETIRLLLSKITLFDKAEALAKEPVLTLLNVIKDYMSVVESLQGVDLGK